MDEINSKVFYDMVIRVRGHSRIYLRYFLDVRALPLW
ncbi:hypothetical protein Thebr_1662 [Thermoanaerobacter brockii subsp. finnii Ako-1]|jgi:hypothetical protein|uniref:Uncharacterized protein n=1 Tax=Thermoanaerobacter brockii subsp. finnii (strain ATCC 43586 / DSM 3389 / AKO-1) TaxID=509193 RepID=E8UV88_THEBF|nr:hypothetical protein Thebr_1662 [Thermoanaerobacter brockii subsp. finnii Ako-1]